MTAENEPAFSLLCHAQHDLRDESSFVMHSMTYVLNNISHKKMTGQETGLSFLKSKPVKKHTGKTQLVLIGGGPNERRVHTTHAFLPINHENKTVWGRGFSATSQNQAILPVMMRISHKKSPEDFFEAS